MSNLSALWAYQEADLKVDRFESEIRQNPMRRKLVQLKKYYSDQQDAMRKAELNTEKTSKGIVNARAQFTLLTEKIDQSAADIDEENFEAATDVREAINSLSDIISRLAALESRLANLMREAGGLASDLRGARANAAKAKKEYADLKVQYDEEFAKQSLHLAELAKERDNFKDGVPPEVLQRYLTIKKRCSPPVAILNGDQCGGCNMSLPALIVSNAKKGAALVECETCGRIIYFTE